MSSSERITAAELERSKRARTIAKNWFEAEETRMKLAGLDPALEGDGTPSVSMRPSKFGRPSPLERVREAHVSGLEIQHFQKGLGGDGNTQQKPAGNSSSLKTDVLKAVIQSGRSPEDAEKLMERLSPFLAVDDPAALLSRIGSSDKMGVKEILEIIQLTNNIQRSQAASDPAALANALATAMKSGVEAAKSNNNSDPTAVLKMITDNQAQSHAQQLQMYERLLDTQQPRSLREQLDDLRGVSDSLGKIAGKESETIQAKRMDLEHERWKTQTEADTERKKSAAQNDMVKTAFGNLGKILESPAIKEAGRGIGQALGKTSPRAGGVVNAVTGAPQTAARTELNTPPTQVPWGLVCHKCHTQHTFTQLQLAQIEESGGRWSCGKCGEVYELRRPPEGGETSGSP